MEDKNNDNLGFLDILSLILITLKLLGAINLAWGWVLLPWAWKYVAGYGVLILGWILEVIQRRKR